MIRHDQDGAVARITLAAPDRHNALDPGGIVAFGAALDALPPDTRVLVIGAEGRTFCAGADLSSLGSDWVENPLTALADRIEALAQATVAALQGSVFGGGIELALACDFRIGVRGMRLHAPPAELGIHYPPEGLARAERLLGLRVTRAMFLAAERFDDAFLLSAGFLDALVAPEAFERAVTERAAHLAALAPLAIQGMKRSLWEAAAPDRVDAAAVRRRIAATYASADHAEALAARKEKRPPRFTGR